MSSTCPLSGTGPAEILPGNVEAVLLGKVAKVFCPIDKNLLLKSGDGRPLYQCSDCSGVLVTLPTPDEQTEPADTASLSTLRCPNDGSVMYGRETRGVIYRQTIRSLNRRVGVLGSSFDGIQNNDLGNRRSIATWRFRCDGFRYASHLWRW